MVLLQLQLTPSMVPIGCVPTGTLLYRYLIVARTKGANIMLGGIVFQLGRARNIAFASRLTLRFTSRDRLILPLRRRVLHPPCQGRARPL